MALASQVNAGEADYATDYLYGRAGDDVLVGNRGNDVLDGDVGSDILFGGRQADRLYGGAGNDTLFGDGDTSAPFDGDAVVFRLAAHGSWADELRGGTGDDYLIGGSDGDLLFGDAGNDRLEGGDGSGDTASYGDAPSAVVVDLSLGTASDGYGTNDTLATIENVIGSAFADRLTGNVTANRLEGGAGDDVLAGLAGADVLLGGQGLDWASYVSSPQGVTVDLGGGGNFGGDAAGDILDSIENVEGSNAADKLVGDGLSNTLFGYLGNDRLEGGGADDHLNGAAGNDVLLGGADNDLLLGGRGADVIDGGDGIDVASYNGATRGVRVSLANDVSFTGDATGDYLVNVENLRGTEFKDDLRGDGRANDLNGLGGDDTVRGGLGNDKLQGEAGDDILLGGGGSDLIVGADGADTLKGEDGDDRLYGGAGADVLTGGAGKDRFALADLDETGRDTARDLITDFKHAQGDRIDFSTLDADPTLGGRQAFIFIGAAAFTADHPGTVNYVIGATTTVVQINTNGDAAAEFQIELTGRVSLVAADFYL